MRGLSACCALLLCAAGCGDDVVDGGPPVDQGQVRPPVVWDPGALESA